LSLVPNPRRKRSGPHSSGRGLGASRSKARVVAATVCNLTTSPARSRTIIERATLPEIQYRRQQFSGLMRSAGLFQENKTACATQLPVVLHFGNKGDLARGPVMRHETYIHFSNYDVDCDAASVVGRPHSKRRGHDRCLPGHCDECQALGRYGATNRDMPWRD
jgi:hypothetical protein